MLWKAASIPGGRIITSGKAERPVALKLSDTLFTEGGCVMHSTHVECVVSVQRVAKTV